MPSSRMRGEGDASAVWTGHRLATRKRNGRAKLLDASGGGAVVARVAFTPTWNAIGLSLPVVLDARDAIGSLSPWHSFLPPQGGGDTASQRGEVGAKSLPCLSIPETSLIEPDSSATRPGMTKIRTRNPRCVSDHLLRPAAISFRPASQVFLRLPVHPVPRRGRTICAPQPHSAGRLARACVPVRAGRR